MAFKNSPGELKTPPSLGGSNSPFGKPQSPLMGDRMLSSSEKRTFKEKLQTAILEAEEAEQAAHREAQMQDKKTLSISLLVDGKPQAFVDFFRFTHPPPVQPSGMAANSSAVEGSGADLPQDSLLLLKAQVAQAEAAKRRGRVEDVYAAYKHLAKHFAHLGQLKTAEFFFKQCLYISKEAAWLPGELEAQLALGVVYEQMNDSEAAIACHERRLELASHHNLQTEMEAAFSQLGAVYLSQAVKREKAGNAAEAIQAYNLCLRAADKVGDHETACRANHKLGMLYFEQQQWQDAMFYLRRYMELCASGGEPTGMDASAEGIAHTSYAQCLKHAGEPQAAIDLLENYLQTSSRGKDPWGPAYASCNLGLLYYEQSDFAQASSHFERFFEITRTLPDRRAAEAARFNLGVARGAMRMQAYMNIVNTDLPALIAWKNSKVPFS